jgi:hypothetical protein
MALLLGYEVDTKVRTRTFFLLDSRHVRAPRKEVRYESL